MVGKNRRVLGIETSCDETAAAIVDEEKNILAQEIYSQLKEHEDYGGVVPEIASRAHMEALERVIKSVMKQAGIEKFEELDAIAVTAGPGLIGGVIVGVMTAKAISSVAKIPIIAVNHLEGHALTVRLTDHVEFPFLLLLLSGGHCQILLAEGVGQYQRLGGTLDDALGEAFDKVAKMLGLGYPGGPAVEKLAKLGDPKRFDLPRPLKGREGCDFSFSGLKTAVRRHIEQHDQFTEQDKADLCASFQSAVAEILIDRLNHARAMLKEKGTTVKDFILSGGVAANQYIGGQLNQWSQAQHMRFICPPIALCTDNAAMIAWTGIERMRLGQISDILFEPKARWPL